MHCVLQHMSLEVQLGGFIVCFPAVPPAETQKGLPWGTLTTEECAQLPGRGCWHPFGSAGCVKVV